MFPKKFPFFHPWIKVLLQPFLTQLNQNKIDIWKPCVFFSPNQRTRCLLCHFQGLNLTWKLRKVSKANSIERSQVHKLRYEHDSYIFFTTQQNWTSIETSDNLHNVYVGLRVRNAKKNRQKSILFLYPRNFSLKECYQYKNFLIVMNFVNFLKRNCYKVLWNFKSFRKHLWKLRGSKCLKMRKIWL